MGRPTKARQAQIAERRNQAIERRIKGESWAMIAEALGYGDAATACKDFTRAMEQRRQELAENVETLRQTELARLDALTAVAWAVMERDHVSVSHGKIVRDEDGEPLLDDGPRLAAIDRLVRIAERRARFEGWDSPVRVQTTGVVTFAVEGVDPEKLR